MLVTESGIVTDVINVFPANASAVIATTGRPAISAGISTEPVGATIGAPNVIGSSPIVSSNNTPFPTAIPQRA